MLMSGIVGSVRVEVFQKSLRPDGHRRSRLGFDVIAGPVHPASNCMPDANRSPGTMGSERIVTFDLKDRGIDQTRKWTAPFQTGSLKLSIRAYSDLLEMDSQSNRQASSY